MNPSFYPKHLARQYAQGGALRTQNGAPLRLQNFERPWAHVYPLPGGENSPPMNNNNNKYSEQQVVMVEGQVQHEQTVGNMSSSTENHQVPINSLSINCKKDAASGSKMQVPKNSAVFSGLPPAFIEAMKKLFDMVDTHREGRVRLEDIADKWSPNSSDSDEHLPKGIVTSLKKVTTSDGYLTFERFCAGLKIAILRHESEKKKKKQRNNSSFDSTQTSESDSSACSSVEPHNKNISEQNSPISVANTNENSPASEVASVLNRGMVSGQGFEEQDPELDEEMQRISRNGETITFADRLSRTNSLPNLQGMETHPGRGGAPLEIGFHEDFIDGLYNKDDNGRRIYQDSNSGSAFVPATRKNITGPSPCPSEPSYPSTGIYQENKRFAQGKSEIGTTNIRRHQSQNVIPTGPPKPPRDPKRMSGHFMTSAYSTTCLPTATASNIPLSVPNGNLAKPSKQQLQQETKTKFIWKEPPNSQVPSHEEDNQKNSNKNKDVVMRSKGGGPVHKRKDLHHTRRHTLQGGVDFSMIKRLRQWEEEKSVLEEGLKATKIAHEWYKTRLEGISERLRKGPEPSATPAANTEAMQERLMFELNSIRELNHRLARLMDLSGQKQYVVGGANVHQSNPDENQSSNNNIEVSENTSYGFPTHMNLEIAKNVSSQNTFSMHHQNALLMERQVQRLKEQNRQLTQEVGQKSNQVTALEQEKRTLIKQVFQRSNHSTNNQIHQNNKPATSTTLLSHLTHEGRRKGGSQSMNNILTAPQSNNRNFDSAKATARNTFVGTRPAIFKSASSLYQQQQF